LVFISKFLLLCLVLSAKCFASHEKYAAIVVDGKTGNVIHGINETHKRYPASLAKKMTLYLLFEALEEGRINLQTRFLVSQRAAGQAPSKMGIPKGQTISVEHIIKSLVVKSANDIAVVAAEGLAGSVEKFAIQMTEKAKELGMNNTVFKNPSGVNDAGTTDKSQYTTARDLAILGIALYRDYPQHAHYYKLRTFNYNGRMIHSHNHMLGSVDGLDGIKTGFANAPGFNISTSVVRNDNNNNPQRLFVVVMGGHSWRSRDRHAEELIEYGFKKLNYENQNSTPARMENISQTVQKSKPKMHLLNNRAKASSNDDVDLIINKKTSRKLIKIGYKNSKKRKR
jgi:D-alanyl-D-alanine carboxypeptidase